MDGLLEKVNYYYTQKLKEFGNTPMGVDWNNAASQNLRFKQLIKIIDKDNFSILDYGCGYGALYDYLKLSELHFTYVGYDITLKMIEAAIKDKDGQKNAFFTAEELLLNKCDYVTASGIFNVRLDVGDSEWQDYISRTLNKMNQFAVKGFSFNMLPSYSDEEHKKKYLYYADSLWVIDLCKRLFSDKVIILKDYSLYEFTILVTK